MSLKKDKTTFTLHFPDDEPKQQFAEDHFDQLKKTSTTGCEVLKGKMLKPVFNQRIWIALFGGLNRQIGFSCY